MAAQPTSPGTAFASGILAGVASAALVAALAIGLGYLFAGSLWWPLGGPDIGALVAAPAAAWTTSRRRRCAIDVRIRVAVLALLLGFLGYWLFDYVMLVGLLAPGGAAYEAGNSAPDITALLTGTMLRAALAIALLNAFVGALLGLMFGRQPGAWAE